MPAMLHGRGNPRGPGDAAHAWFTYDDARQDRLRSKLQSSYVIIPADTLEDEACPEA